MAKVIFANKEEAQRGLARFKSGDLDSNPETKEAVLKGLQSFVTRRKATSHTDAAVLTPRERDAFIGKEVSVLGQTSQVRDPVAKAAEFGGDVLRTAKGVGEVGLAAGVGFVSTVGAGLHGLYTARGGAVGIPSKQSLNKAADDVRDIQELISFSPSTQTGEELLRGLGSLMKGIDDTADSVATFLGEGSALAKTFIYTTLLSLPDLLGLKGGRALSVGRSGKAKFQAQLEAIEAAAKEAGINLDPAKMSKSVIEVAEAMSPDVRAANAGALRDALQQSHQLMRESVTESAALSRQSKTFINTKEASKFGKAARQDLAAEGYDISGTGMKGLRDNLDSIELLDKRSPTDLTRPSSERPTDFGSFAAREQTRIQDVQMISDRLSKVLAKKQPRGMPDSQNPWLATKSLKKKLDNWLDQQFNSDMISGDIRGLRRWKDAERLRKQYDARYNMDKSLRQLMDRDATPEQLHRWLIGASAASSKVNAGAVVQRLKNVLGRRHPSIQGIRQDMMFELSAPLLQERPNFSQFVTNYDKLVKNNSSLARELDIDMSVLGKMRGFIDVAAKLDLPGARAFMSRQAFTDTMARLMFGHEIAKAGVRVKLYAGALRILTGQKRITQKQILNDLTNAKYGVPVFDKSSVAAGRIISGAALAELGVSKEKIDEVVGK